VRRRHLRPAEASLVSRVTAGLVAVVATLSMLAAPSAAAPSGDPVRFWSVSKELVGTGDVPVSSGAQVGAVLKQSAKVGRVVFNLPLHAPYWYFLPRDSAFGSVFSSADGAQYSVMAQAPTPNPLRLGAPTGAVTHLDQYQAYQKRESDATLKITLSDLLLQTVDDNNSLAAWECPLGQKCDLVRTVVRFHARAYAASAGGDFFDVGGSAYLVGHQHSWQPGAWTSADSERPLWGELDFDVDGDADDSGTGAAGVMALNKAIRLQVPLDAVRPGELFAVHVSLEAEAVDERGGESAAQSFIQDPQHPGQGLLLSAHGLAPRGKPKFKEPPIKSLPAARCPSGPRPHAGTVQLSSSEFVVGEAGRTPQVVVTRKGGSQGATSVIVSTSGGSARPGTDFRPIRTVVRFANRDTSPRLVEIPIREDRSFERTERFKVSLSDPRCGKLGKQRSASVAIVDDDHVGPPPMQEFKLGGTVDGLRGSGLGLTNLGNDMAVSANGSFTFPGTVPTGQSYEVKVRTQPHNPDQVCSVQHGSGRVSTANVTNVAVHCATTATPSGLDSTFGSGGRVSTPVGGGQGEAVVIQPGGGIVTAGWRTVGSGTDFALTRNAGDGTLDSSFGQNGIATTDLGGADDEAFDAALLPDNGIVVVGRADASGILKTTFGVVRYRPDGTPNPNFGTGGIVTTPFFGKGAVANAVAVQPDGKIVVAGFADEASGSGSDFALARYNADGTLDTSFDGDGIVTTDLSGQDDEITALEIQPDGKIVAVGTAGEDIGLARYAPDGQLDTSFGNGGSKITDLGFVDVANGVALTRSGQIVIAGYTIGAKLSNDFLLARYDTNGTLDTTFGGGGVVKTDVSGADDFAENLVIDGQGRIILVGRATSSTILDMALARYKADGTLDAGFANHGTLTADFHGRGEFGQDVALDPQGRIVAAGYTANGSGTEFALMRANS
jgi:uncharacterized delta-60 repeat protein